VTFHRPGEGESYELGGSQISLKVGADGSAGTLFLSESRLEVGFIGPPLHIHRRMHDMFYVLEGTLTVQVGDDRRAAPAGSFLCVPPGMPHTFANFSDGTVRVLNLSTPGGFEVYIRELAAAWANSGGPPSLEVVRQIASNHDIEVVGPPLQA
jgi:mannose-6-phosphate isomerase-like protein (cupin superfamily)